MSKNFTIPKTLKSKGGLLFFASIVFFFPPVNSSTIEKITEGQYVMQQEKKISGLVTDENGEPLTGVTILLKGTNLGAITDIDGNYTMSVPNLEGTLTFKYLGYITRDEKINNKDVVNVRLQEDSKALGEVVVTALGIKREAKQLGYSMQELKGDALLESRENNVLNALSGKVAGLQVLRSGNGMGGSTKIVLRGTNSLTGNNQPLIVIDGIPMDNFTGGVDDVFGNTGRDMGSGLADIDQENIESMSVLKGASAAALYGARAGNGVILITTKSGKERPGIGVTVNAGISIETAFLKAKTQKIFSQGSDGIYDPISRYSWGAKIEGQDVLDWKGETVKLRSYDNYNAFFRPGVSYNESVSFQQNVNGVSVFASVNRSDDANTTPEAKLSKTGLSLRATAFLDKAQKWQIDGKANYMVTEAKNRPIMGMNQSNANMTIYTLPTNIDLEYFKHNTYTPQGNMNWWQPENSTPQENPFWVVHNRNNSDTRHRLLGSMKLKFKPTSWIDLEVNGGTDYYSTQIYEKTNAGSPASENGRYVENKETFYENNYSFLARATRDNLVDKLGMIFSFGGNLLFQDRTTLNADAGRLVIPNYFNLNNGVDAAKITATDVKRRMNSLYGVLNLSWDNYLYFDVTGRNDWSSTLSKANRSFFYPSFNLAYLPTEMMKNYDINYPDWLTFLKVRGSYAVVGNDLDPYQLYNVYKMEKNALGYPIMVPGEIKFNDNVKSELIKSYEAGIDMRFLNGRIGLDFTWYKKNATRQLIQLPMNPLSGYKSQIINAGNIQNQGIEIAINADILQPSANGLGWNLGVNLSRNKDKIISLYEGVETYPLGQVDESVQILAKVGGTYGGIYGKKYMRVEDPNSPHNGKIIVNEQGLPTFTANNEYLGNQAPKAMLGISNNFTFKNFNLGFLVDARFGGKIFSGTTAILNRYGTGIETVNNGGRDNFVVPNTVIKKADGTLVENNVEVTHQQYWEQLTANTNFGLGEQYTYDATNIRLRNVSLGYNFDKKILQKTPFQSLKVSATCTNVWMIHSKLKGIDPESVSATNSNAVGYEANGAPSTRSFVFNLTVGF